MTNNQSLSDINIAPNSAQLKAMAECLLDYLKVHGKSERPFEVLQFLASGTLRRLSEGLDPRFNNYAIRDAVTGEAEGDASAWLSPLWKKITTDLRQQREEGLQEFAAERGLDCYPWVGKLESSGGGGNQALYYVVALPLSESVSRSTAPTTLGSPSIDPHSQVCISTIQRMYSILSGEPIDDSAEDLSLNELQQTTKQEKYVRYNPAVPVEIRHHGIGSCWSCIRSSPSA